MSQDPSSRVHIRHGHGGSVLSCSQWIDRRRDEVFAFFADAGNLERITPPFLRFRIVCMTTPQVGRGTVIAYRLRLHGMPIRWRSLIADWDPPHAFTDVQISGPFRFWHHRHELSDEGGGTRVADVVHYRLFCASLLRTPVMGWVERDLRAIFEFRRHAIAATFAGPRSGIAR